MAGTVSPKSSPIVACLAQVRDYVGDQQFVSQSRSVDLLLDCLNAARRPAVRSTICQALAEISHVGVVAGKELRTILDSVALSFEVDTAFDHFDLAEA